jgi:LacI family transcriptional regulator
MRVRLADIAREAGVDTATVSRALNSGYGVRKELRARIADIAKRMSYRPNLVARGLVTGRSHTLALAISDIRNPFFSELARGAEDAARAAGYDLVLCNSDFDPAKQMAYFWSLQRKRVDGIIMAAVDGLDREQVRELETAGTPVVLLSRLRGTRAFSSVRPDNARGGAIAAAYLAGLKHRKLAVLAGPPRHTNMKDRTTGFLAAVRAAGLPDPLTLHARHDVGSGYEMGKKLFADRKGVTAIFATNDALAFGVLRAALDCGVRIPADISLIGFDDVEMASISHPPLTTIRQPKYELGQAAAEILIRRAGNADVPPEHRVFDVRLVERQSCRPLA